MEDGGWAAAVGYASAHVCAVWLLCDSVPHLSTTMRKS